MGQQAGLGGYIYLDRASSELLAGQPYTPLANRQLKLTFCFLCSLPLELPSTKSLAKDAQSALQDGQSKANATASDLSSKAVAIGEQAKDKAQEVGKQVKEKAEEVGDQIKTALIKDQWVDFKFEGSKPYNDNTSV